MVSRGNLRKRPAFICRALFIALGLASEATHAADVRLPARNEVVETQLLPRAVKQSVRQLEGTRTAAKGVIDVPPAQMLDNARRLIQAGRASGDPRTLGYAEAQLAGLPDSGALGIEALVLRATIEQSRHRFDTALALLDRALEQAPAHVQARLTRATIGHVRGDLAAARTDCDVLSEPAPAVASICVAINDSLSGENAPALELLESVTEPSLRGWALSLAGEVHEQQGALEAAAQAYRNSLAAAPDLYTTVALADVLIEQQRWAQADALLAPLPPTDAVLVRRWIAQRAQGDAAGIEAQLAARFGEAQARGELLHAREAALFALARGDSATALTLAQQNWRDQREPADLRILAAAARAADDAAALALVREWLSRTGLRDVRVERALQGTR